MSSHAVELAVELKGVSFCYGERRALDGVEFSVSPGEVFAVLGPNGGGKSTLFRLLSTLVRPQQGFIRIFGRELPREQATVREMLGVVFQSPSLDRQLTVAENLACHAALFGIRGTAFRDARDRLLEQFGLTARANERVDALSGGLRRRVELAQALLHRPRLLLLDEPSTGLDPGARIEMWRALRSLRDQHNVTIMLTTHLLEEADKADRLALLDAGKLVALDSPAALRATVGGDSLTIIGRAPETLAREIQRQFGVTPRMVDGAIRLEIAEASVWIPRLVNAFADRIETVTLGRPTLEDVFIAKTGRRLDQPSEQQEPRR